MVVCCLMLNMSVRQTLATTIVVIRTPAEIVLAADSRDTFEDKNSPTRTSDVCKIYQSSGGIYFALSGLVSDRVTGFSLARLVARASGHHRRIADKVKSAEQLIGEALISELPEVKARDPEGYRKFIREKSVLSVVFAGVEDGVLTVHGFSAMLAVSPGGVTPSGFVEEACPGNCPNGTRGFWLGEAGAIKRLMAAQGLPRLPTIDLAKYLVQLEIESDADSVGGPIDLLRITSTGSEWTQRKSGCPVSAPDPDR